MGKPYLRWLCVGLGWGGLAGAVAGICPHLVSRVGGVVAGVHPSGSGTALTEKCKSLHSFHLCVCVVGKVTSYLVPPWGLLRRCCVLPGLFPICQQETWMSQVSSVPLPARRAWWVGRVRHEACRQRNLSGYVLCLWQHLSVHFLAWELAQDLKILVGLQTCTDRAALEL